MADLHQTNIDCHVLTMPVDNPRWLSALLSDLRREPVNVHVLPGARNDIGSARSRAYMAGTADYVTFADSDDRIVAGTFERLLDAMESNAGAPFAYCGERMMSRDGYLGGPQFLPAEYSGVEHRKKRRHIHGVVLMRRDLVERELHALPGIKSGDVWCLTLRLAKYGLPVALPFVGRHWRQHPMQNSRRAQQKDIDLARERSKQSKTSQYSRTFAILPKMEKSS